jgi:hypothetical protein
MMNTASAPQSTPGGLKLGSMSSATANPAPVRTPPVPPPLQSRGEPTQNHDSKKDGFLAAATLGGIFAALAMMIIAPSCMFLVGRVKQGFSGNRAPIVQPAEPVRVVTWPEIALSGVLAANGQREGSAILNGQLISLNQRLHKVRVVAVQDQEVVLEYQGARKSLRVGDSTL